jgi:hypothetical protein
MNNLIWISLLAVTAAFAQTSEGSLTVDGKATRLSRAYAFSTQGFFDKSKNDTVVVLCDQPLTEAQFRDDFALRGLARDGKLAFVREVINQSGQIINFTVGHSALKMTPSGGSTEHVFEGKQDAKSISGKAFTRGKQKSFDDIFYEYSATFLSAVLPKK